MNSPYGPSRCSSGLPHFGQGSSSCTGGFDCTFWFSFRVVFYRGVLVLARAGHKRPPRSIAQHHHAPAVVAELLFLLLNRIRPRSIQVRFRREVLLREVAA